ncbi:hypothetical protein DMH08_37340 [Actinomadura sp. WAC 06369]|nr:hypothetical protein DMH08_37340 [Actinomadura sp. WAC 06369]
MGAGTSTDHDDQIGMLDDVSVAEQPNGSGYTGRTVLIRDVGQDFDTDPYRTVAHPVAVTQDQPCHASDGVVDHRTVGVSGSAPTDGYAHRTTCVLGGVSVSFDHLSPGPYWFFLERKRVGWGESE